MYGRCDICIPNLWLCDQLRRTMRLLHSLGVLRPISDSTVVSIDYSGIERRPSGTAYDLRALCAAPWYM